MEQQAPLWVCAIRSNYLCDLTSHHFVVIQTEIFAIFKIRLNMPSGSNGLHHLRERSVRGSKHKEVALFRWIGETAADEHKVDIHRFATDATWG